VGKDLENTVLAPEIRKCILNVMRQKIKVWIMIRRSLSFYSKI